MIRERLYEVEKITLSPYAQLCQNTAGRIRKIPESEMRTEYMRDRDRIVHCKSFRRLKDKTQVFINPSGSHYRTRLTHTLEVAQISRTIARALGLNEDLTEAIALGHDLGHTPFGHAGEKALAKLMPGFEHNVQSLRIVDHLEKQGAGLNLTEEVRDGILNHKKSGTPKTLEGRAVSYADRIAYLNHDIDDSLRAQLFSQDALPEECMKVLGRTSSERINTMITDIVTNSLNHPMVEMTKEVGHATETLRDFMFKAVYERTSPAKREESKVDNIIALIFEYYLKHPDELPPECHDSQRDCDPIHIRISDYIAGMTDKFAVTRFEELYVPHSWNIG